MSTSLQVAVLGLGRFGLSVASELTRLGTRSTGSR